MTIHYNQNNSKNENNWYHKNKNDQNKTANNHNKDNDDDSNNYSHQNNHCVKVSFIYLNFHVCTSPYTGCTLALKEIPRHPRRQRDVSIEHARTQRTGRWSSTGQDVEQLQSFAVQLARGLIEDSGSIQGKRRWRFIFDWDTLALGNNFTQTPSSLFHESDGDIHVLQRTWRERHACTQRKCIWRMRNWSARQNPSANGLVSRLNLKKERSDRYLGSWPHCCVRGRRFHRHFVTAVAWCELENKWQVKNLNCKPDANSEVHHLDGAREFGPRACTLVVLVTAKQNRIKKTVINTTAGILSDMSTKTYAPTNTIGIGHGTCWC